MKITALTTFLDGPDRFEKGHTYEVDAERGGRLVSHRWATSPDIDQSWLDGAVSARTLPGAVVLEPHDVSSEDR